MNDLAHKGKKYFTGPRPLFLRDSKGGYIRRFQSINRAIEVLDLTSKVGTELRKDGRSVLKDGSYLEFAEAVP